MAPELKRHPNNGDEYRCDQCGEIFKATRDDAEALAESDAIFGRMPSEGEALVCHECWLLLMRPRGEC